MFNHKDLSEKLEEMLNDDKLWILNVQIDPNASRKPQEFAWLTRDEKAESPKL